MQNIIGPDEFFYQTVCLHMLTGILDEVSGMTTVDYANKYLFEPIGVSKHRGYYADSAEKHKSFIKSFKKAQVKASDYCFYDLVPETFLLEFYSGYIAASIPVHRFILQTI